MKTNINDKEGQAAFEESQKSFTNSDLAKVVSSENQLENTFKKADELKSFFNDFKALFSMIKDYYNGKYKDVPWNIIAAIGGVLIYVLSPLDLIPDFIPVLGYLDDATVFSFCLNFIKKDIDKYKNWKNSHYIDY